MDGVIHPDFHRVAKAFERAIRSGGGGAVAVSHHGEPVVDLWGGVRDDAGTPWERETVALSFSTTKGVVAVVAATLVDQGLLDYDAPVREYWPEFAAAGKQDTTVRHLLSHTAGMHRIRGIATGEQMLDWDYTVGALAEAAPAWQPGSRPGYHGITYGWLVGEVIRRVTGGTVDDAVGSQIREPLGIEGGLGIGLCPDKRSDYAALSGRDSSDRLDPLFRRMSGRPRFAATVDAFYVEDFLDVVYGPEVLDAELPAVNGVFSARGLAAMYSSLVAPGASSFLGESTLHEATTVQTTGRDAVIHMPMRWRLGFHMAATTRGVVDTGFGHFGYGGSGAWADPTSGLAVAFVTNRVAGTPFGDTRMLRIGGAALNSAKRRAPR